MEDFFPQVTFKFDAWPKPKKRHLFYIPSSFVHNFKPIIELKLELISETLNWGPN